MATEKKDDRIYVEAYDDEPTAEELAILPDWARKLREMLKEHGIFKV